MGHSQALKVQRALDTKTLGDVTQLQSSIQSRNINENQNKYFKKQSKIYNNFTHKIRQPNYEFTKILSFIHHV